MTIQYSSDTKRAYEDYLKQYDADKSGISDWTEYLTSLQLGVKDQTQAYKSSGLSDISNAYNNYVRQQQLYGSQGLSEGAMNVLSQRNLSNFLTQEDKINAQTASNITNLFTEYGKTVTSAGEKLSERAGTLQTLTEAALDWYEQVGKDKRVLDDEMKETDKYRYESLIDLYNQNKGELWKNVSTDLLTPKYELSNLGHAIIDTAFADEGFAEYLKDYSDKEDLRDAFFDNKELLYDALGVGKLPKNISNIIKENPGSENLPLDITQLTYTTDSDIVTNIVKNVKETPERDFVTASKVLTSGDEIYDNYLQYLKPTALSIFNINGDYYRYDPNRKTWAKVRQATDEEKRNKQSSAVPVPVAH